MGEGLNNKHLFLTVLEAGKSNIKVVADSVPGENPPPGLQMATFSPCPRSVSPPAVTRCESHRGSALRAILNLITSGRHPC